MFLTQGGLLGTSGDVRQIQLCCITLKSPVKNHKRAAGELLHTSALWCLCSVRLVGFTAQRQEGCVPERQPAEVFYFPLTSLIFVFAVSINGGRGAVMFDSHGGLVCFW